MKTGSRPLLPGIVGALVGVGIVAAFGSGVVAVDSGAVLHALFVSASLGQAVAEFTALGFILGLAAFGLRRLAAYVVATRRLSGIVEGITQPSATITPIPRLADATASEFDDSLQPTFASVTSLTEVQVERQRAQRRRDDRRATLEGA
jgi:hypothetical protein